MSLVLEKVDGDTSIQDDLTRIRNENYEAIENAVNAKAESADVYTQTQIDNALANKQDKAITIDEQATTVESAINLNKANIENILVGQDLDPNKDVELLASRVSGVTGDTFNTIGDRMDNLETVITQDGKKYKIIAGVIRNEGDGFELIDNSGHRPLNLSSVTTDSSYITVNYSFAASKVGSLQVSVDEKLAQKGFFAGASVGVDNVVIFLRKTDNVSGYISKSGGASPIFTISKNQGINSVTWENSYLLINHEKCYNYSGISVITRNPSVQCIPSSMDASGENTYLKFYDYDGNVITPPDGLVILFNRIGGGIVDPNDVVYTDSNLWIYGIMETE